MVAAAPQVAWTCHILCYLITLPAQALWESTPPPGGGLGSCRSPAGLGAVASPSFCRQSSACQVSALLLPRSRAEQHAYLHSPGDLHRLKLSLQVLG